MMFESRPIEESPMEDVLSTSRSNTRRDATQILENNLDYDPEDEEDKILIQVVR